MGAIARFTSRSERVTWPALVVLSFAVGCGEVHEHVGADAGNRSGGARPSQADGGSNGSGGTTSGGTTASAARAAGGGAIGLPDVGMERLAQAALSVQSVPAAGKVCTTTNGRLGFPTKYNASVYSELNCDLSQGCRPDEYVVVDRDQGASVTCSVTPSGDNYAVQLSLIVDGSATGEVSGDFALGGVVSATGGTVRIQESNSVAGGGGMESDCTVTISPPKGLVAKGKIWGSFDCPAFQDPTNIGDTGCDVSGQFLFENCGP